MRYIKFSKYLAIALLTFTIGISITRLIERPSPSVIAAAGGRLPATCSAGPISDIFYSSESDVYVCSEPNTWVRVAPGSGIQPASRVVTADVPYPKNLRVGDYIRINDHQFAEVIKVQGHQVIVRYSAPDTFKPF